MKGYLERLATSVLHPGGSIRPVLAPVYYARHDIPNAPHVDEEVNVRPVPRPSPEERAERPPLEVATLPAVSMPPPSAQAQRTPFMAAKTPAAAVPAANAPLQADRAVPPAADKENPSQGRPVTTHPQSNVEGEVPLHREVSSITPLGHQDRPAIRNRFEETVSPQDPSVIYVQQVVSSPPPRMQPTIPKGAEPNSERARSAVEDEKHSPEGQRVIPRDRLVPLPAPPGERLAVPDGVSTEPKPKFTPLVTPAFAPSAVQPMRDSPGRAVPLADEPDEIHIHIGRIEVMASAPAPARSAPAKAARKTLTLDEFLKQRHGRA